jgi:hypothetical protein
MGPQMGNRAVATLVRYMVHDPIHHVWDVEGTTAGQVSPEPRRAPRTVAV